MKSFLPITCFLLLTHLLSGQDFLDLNPTWYVRHTDIGFSPPPYPERSIIYRLGKWDTIGHVVYREVEYTIDSSMVNWQPSGYSLWQNGDTVFYRFEDLIWNEEKILFIYDWEEGTSYEGCYWSRRLLNQDSTFNQGRWHTLYYTNSGPRIIEGIGQESFIFPLSGYCATDQGAYYLHCFYHGDSLVYKSEDILECFLPPLTVSSEDKFVDDECWLTYNVIAVGSELTLAKHEAAIVSVYGLDGKEEGRFMHPAETVIFQTTGLKILTIAKDSKVQTYEVLVTR